MPVKDIAPGYFRDRKAAEERAELQREALAAEKEMRKDQDIRRFGLGIADSLVGSAIKIGATTAQNAINDALYGEREALGKLQGADAYEYSKLLASRLGMARQEQPTPGLTQAAAPRVSVGGTGPATGQGLPQSAVRSAVASGLGVAPQSAAPKLPSPERKNIVERSAFADVLKDDKPPRTTTGLEAGTEDIRIDAIADFIYDSATGDSATKTQATADKLKAQDPIVPAGRRQRIAVDDSAPAVRIEPSVPDLAARMPRITEERREAQRKAMQGETKTQEPPSLQVPLASEAPPELKPVADEPVTGEPLIKTDLLSYDILSRMPPSAAAEVKEVKIASTDKPAGDPQGEREVVRQITGQQAQKVSAPTATPAVTPAQPDTPQSRQKGQQDMARRADIISRVNRNIGPQPLTGLPVITLEQLEKLEPYERAVYVKGLAYQRQYNAELEAASQLRQKRALEIEKLGLEIDIARRGKPVDPSEARQARKDTLSAVNTLLPTSPKSYFKGAAWQTQQSRFFNGYSSLMPADAVDVVQSTQFMSEEQAKETLKMVRRQLSQPAFEAVLRGESRLIGVPQTQAEIDAQKRAEKEAIRTARGFAAKGGGGGKAPDPATNDPGSNVVAVSVPFVNKEGNRTQLVSPYGNAGKKGKNTVVSWIQTVENNLGRVVRSGEPQRKMQKMLQNARPLAEKYVDGTATREDVKSLNLQLEAIQDYAKDPNVAKPAQSDAVKKQEALDAVEKREKQFLRDYEDKVKDADADRRTAISGALKEAKNRVLGAAVVIGKGGQRIPILKANDAIAFLSAQEYGKPVGVTDKNQLSRLRGIFNSYKKQVEDINSSTESQKKTLEATKDRLEKKYGKYPDDFVMAAPSAKEEVLAQLNPRNRQLFDIVDGLPVNNGLKAIIFEKVAT